MKTSKLRIAGLALFGLVSLFLIWFGATYATVKDLLWFHAAAVPEAARADVRPLYIALMTLIGGASLSLGLLGAYVTAFPLRRAAPGAGTMLALVYLLVFAMAGLTAEKLAHYGAPTSWHIMGVLGALTIAGYLACAFGARSRAA